MNNKQLYNKLKNSISKELFKNVINESKFSTWRNEHTIKFDYATFQEHAEEFLENCVTLYKQKEITDVIFYILIDNTSTTPFCKKIVSLIDYQTSEGISINTFIEDIATSIFEIFNINSNIDKNNDEDFAKCMNNTYFKIMINPNKKFNEFILSELNIGKTAIDNANFIKFNNSVTKGPNLNIASNYIINEETFVQILDYLS